MYCNILCHCALCRSSENLTSSEGEGDRHCVAGGLVVGEGGMGGSSQSSLSDREQENGYTEEEEEERGEFTVSLREPSSEPLPVSLPSSSSSSSSSSVACCL